MRVTKDLDVFPGCVWGGGGEDRQCKAGVALRVWNLITS